MKNEIYLVTVGDKNMPYNKDCVFQDLENVQSMFNDLGITKNSNWIFMSAHHPISIDKISGTQAIDLANKFPEIIDIIEQLDLKIEEVI